ncbi:KH domain-containing protein [Candidatus Formimonas warabiya]|uniref:RNA-binding protein KhpA n=1 Tax=Formimonas warabiya TaxID=1761012 RepID=A0A3G1KQ58_FORW1|nr:KH domain-containing protein [Candidatus Formimonas warabiya]ATW24609.1 RNA-binding protein [Candidatus Formimonas warabiya]
MRDLVEYLAKALVENPDAVSVKVEEKDKLTVLELRVAPEDMGKVIGKQGRIAKAIRTVVKAVATKEGKKASVDIM